MAANRLDTLIGPHWPYDKIMMALPSQVYVPVRAVGTRILDNGGDVIAECFTPDLARRIATLLNFDAQRP